MLVVILAAVGLVSLAVIVHYNALVRMSLWLPTWKGSPRKKVLYGVFGALGAHFIEVWLFAAGYALLCIDTALGDLITSAGERSQDYFYFSFVVYTSLGFGDVVPHGGIRYLSAAETLTGLVLIAWTASFLYYQVHRYWAGEGAEDANQEVRSEPPSAAATESTAGQSAKERKP